MTPPPPRRPWRWVLATFASLAALVFVGILYWQARVTAEHTERAFQAVSASNETLTKAIEKWRIAGETSADSAAQVGFRPLVLAVPFGEQALNPSRLESVRALVAQLERAAISGVVRIENFAGNFCLENVGTDGYTLAAPASPASRCDQVGNPFDDSGADSSRQPVAFANLASTLRRRTGGAIELALVPGPRDRLAVAYPPKEQATAGQWNAAAQAEQSHRDQHRRAMNSFQPPAWLAHRHLQSVLPSLPIRRGAIERRAADLIAASRDLVLDCGEGVRLMGRLAEPPAAGRSPARRLAVLLHGWEGSSESLDLLSLAQLLFARGYTVLRLNLRDHGGTHALNRELFHSCRLPEVVGAVARAQALYPDHRLLLAGFSARRQLLPACRRARRARPGSGLRASSPSVRYWTRRPRWKRSSEGPRSTAAIFSSNGGDRCSSSRRPGRTTMTSAS